MKMESTASAAAAAAADAATCRCRCIYSFSIHSSARNSCWLAGWLAAGALSVDSLNVGVVCTRSHAILTCAMLLPPTLQYAYI